MGKRPANKKPSTEVAVPDKVAPIATTQVQVFATTNGKGENVMDVVENPSGFWSVPDEYLRRLKTAHEELKRAEEAIIGHFELTDQPIPWPFPGHNPHDTRQYRVKEGDGLEFVELPSIAKEEEIHEAEIVDEDAE